MADWQGHGRRDGEDVREGVKQGRRWCAVSIRSDFSQCPSSKLDCCRDYQMDWPWCRGEMDLPVGILPIGSCCAWRAAAQLAVYHGRRLHVQRYRLLRWPGTHPADRSTRIRGDAIQPLFPSCADVLTDTPQHLHRSLSGEEWAYPNHTFVPQGTRSVVQLLKPLGYRVALSGKTHIAPKSVFDFEYLGKGKNPNFVEVESFLSSSKLAEIPFCLLLCSNEPHDPWDKGDPSQYDAAKLKLPPTWVDTPETRADMTRYLAEITYFDGQVATALRLLEKHGLVDNTLVMLVSEQGSIFPFAKWTCYDAGLQSAMIVRWPGVVEAGTVSDAMVEYTDILPTFIEAAGGKPDAGLDGRSFWPVLTGGRSKHKQFVFGEMTSRGILHGPDHYGIRSVRSERYKYIWNLTPEVEFSNIAMQKGFFRSWERKAARGDADAAAKVARFRKRPMEELYDVVNDPHELHNLADVPAHAEAKMMLREKLLVWMDACGDHGQATEMAARDHQTTGRNNREKRGK